MDEYEDLYLSIDLVCFGNRLPFIRLYPFSDVGDYFDKSALAGVFVSDYPFHKIFLNTEYLNKNPPDEKIHILHHEMTHLYCELQGIQDTEERDGINFHKRSFKDAIERNGGKCFYTDDRFGWCDSELTPEKMKKVKKYMKL